MSAVLRFKTVEEAALSYAIPAKALRSLKIARSGDSAFAFVLHLEISPFIPIAWQV
jgi:hypothetical protein